MTGLGNKEILSKNLKYYIDKSGKDRRQLAEIWGVPYSTLTGWVNAQKYPRIDKIEIMADYFGILKSDLIEEKLTEETELEDDIIVDIMVRMNKDADFRALVESLYMYDAAKIRGIRQMLQAFSD